LTSKNIVNDETSQGTSLVLKAIGLTVEIR